MPLPGNGTPAGSVPLDAMDAGEIADLLAGAAGIAGALAGQPDAEAARAEHAPGLVRPGGRNASRLGSGACDLRTRQREGRR